jgi:hypothetical protein
MLPSAFTSAPQAAGDAEESPGGMVAAVAGADSARTAVETAGRKGRLVNFQHDMPRRLRATWFPIAQQPWLAGR